MLTIRDSSGVLRTIRKVFMRDASNVLRELKTVQVRDASNVLRTIFSALSVTASPTGVEGYAAASIAVSITTGSTLLTFAGGTAPYTVSWSFADGGWTSNGLGSDYWSFRSPAVVAGSDASSTATPTVTDHNGATATGAPIGVYVQNFGS